jgi:hypothetical protein
MKAIQLPLPDPPFGSTWRYQGSRYTTSIAGPAISQAYLEENGERILLRKGDVVLPGDRIVYVLTLRDEKPGDGL